MDVGENSHCVSITFPTLPIPSFLFILKYAIPDDRSPTMALTLTVQKNYLNTLPQFSSYLQTCGWNHIFPLFFLFGFFFSLLKNRLPLTLSPTSSSGNLSNQLFLVFYHPSACKKAHILFYS